MHIIVRSHALIHFVIYICDATVEANNKNREKKQNRNLFFFIRCQQKYFENDL